MKTIKTWTEKHKTIVRLILSYYSLWSLSGMIKSQNTEYAISNSIFALFLFLFIYTIYKKENESVYDRSVKVVTAILGFFYSATLLFGRNIMMEDTLFINQLGTWLKIIGGTFFFGACTRLLYRFLETGICRFQKIRFFNKLDTVKHPFLIDWLLIFIAWIPLWILCFPGIYAYDSVYQVLWYEQGTLYTHHPLLHTLFLGWCIKDFPNPEAGMAFYSIIQMLTLSLSFATVSSYLRKQEQPVLVRRLVLLWFMFFPPNALMACSATKDVFFTAFFVIFLVLMAEGIHNKENLKSWKWKCAMILSGFFVLALRSQSRYVLILTLLIGMLIWRKQLRKTMTILLVGILVLFQIYNGPVTKALGGLPYDSIREMMSVPLMQMSRALIYSPDKLDKKVQEEIKEYIPTYETYSIFPSISDNLKRYFNLEKFKEDPIAFVSLWANVGIKCPINYIDAFCRLNVASWYPDMNERDLGAWHPYMEFDNSKPENEEWTIVKRMTPEFLQSPATKVREEILENKYQKIPLLSLFWSSGFTTWLMFFLLGYACVKKRWKLLPLFSIPVLMWMTLLLAPVILFRYMYPVMASIPVLWGALKITGKEEKDCKNES